jgi:transposase-like protein
VQTCIVHLIRHSLTFVSWKDRKVMPALRAIYRAEDAEAGLKAGAMWTVRRSAADRLAVLTTIGSSRG